MKPTTVVPTQGCGRGHNDQDSTQSKMNAYYPLVSKTSKTKINTMENLNKNNSNTKQIQQNLLHYLIPIKPPNHLRPSHPVKGMNILHLEEIIPTNLTNHLQAAVTNKPLASWHHRTLPTTWSQTSLLVKNDHLTMIKILSLEEGFIEKAQRVEKIILEEL